MAYHFLLITTDVEDMDFWGFVRQLRSVNHLKNNFIN